MNTNESYSKIQLRLIYRFNMESRIFRWKVEHLTDILWTYVYIFMKI